MLRTILQGRAVLALLVAAVVGTWGLHAFPVPTDNPFLALIAARRPHVFAVLSYGYATLWFTTPYLMASIVASLVTIVVFRTMPSVAYRPLPAYPEPEERPAPTLVLGETHEIAAPGRSPEPTWLTIPQRGLYTGIMILGAVGTGKTSACMYPYVDQLLRWRAADPDLKMGGLVLEVKGDFCRQVRTILARAGRESDYVEVGLNSGVCYNPLHNDLDPYAVSYAVATLLNNLFGRSKEPFWQQAYTDLLKFVISLRRITDGYTTLAEVYRYIIDDKLIDKNIRALQAQFKDPGDVLVVPQVEHALHLRQAPWTLWVRFDGAHMAHPYDAELETFLAERGLPFTVRTGDAAIAADRRHRLEAIERWYYSAWARLDPKVRSSIVEGAVVFLSLFDENPEVYRAFCPPRSAYAKPPEPGEPRPLPPLEDLLETRSCARPQLPGRPEPGPGSRPGRDAEARLPACRPAAHSADGGASRAVVARPAVRRRRVPRLCHGRRDGSDGRRAGVRAVAAGAAHSDRRDAEPEFAAVGAGRRRELAHAGPVLPHQAVPGDQRRVHRAHGRGVVRQERPAQDAVHAGRGRTRARTSRWLTGRAAASKQTLSASKSYSFESDYVFQPRVFTELQNAQAVALPYDGLNPLPPQYCYLKPHYLDVRQSYFDHLERGAL